MRDKCYITTPIFYPNGSPHIGHAYDVIAADSLARFQRSNGKDVFFLTGTDEHGLKMQQTAEKEGMPPLALADRNTALFQQMLHNLNISNDDFIRTTEERHYQSCQALWKRMVESGDIYLGHYSGWYSVRQEAYYDEKDTEVGLDSIRREKEVGSPVSWHEEESYFFRLSNYQEKLLDYYENHPDFIGPEERKNEIISFVRSGLRDLSVSRSRSNFYWGIPVPDHESHIMYVWIDALANYVTALGFPDETAERWSYWPANIHMIGKDIIRFHTIYWPAFLMSAGLPLPKRIFAHGFLLNRGEKMSKSVGNVVDPFHLSEKFGVDTLRYFFLREVPFGQDGIYSDEAVAKRANADLSNDLGNLAQRSLAMIAKNCHGIVETPADFLSQDKIILQKSATTLSLIREHMEKPAPHLALTAIFDLVGDTNRYFVSQEPWALLKQDKARFSTVLYVTIEVIRHLALMLLPFIPESAHKLLDLLAVKHENRCFYDIEHDKIEPGRVLPSPQGIFPRFIAKE